MNLLKMEDGKIKSVITGMNEDEAERFLASQGVDIYEDEKDKIIDSIKVIETMLGLGYESEQDEALGIIHFKRKISVGEKFGISTKVLFEEYGEKFEWSEDTYEESEYYDLFTNSSPKNDHVHEGGNVIMDGETVVIKGFSYQDYYNLLLIEIEETEHKASIVLNLEQFKASCF